MDHLCGTTMISWSVTRYRVTTVWLHVEALHSMLGKICGEDCGPEGLCPQLFACSLSETFGVCFVIILKNKMKKSTKYTVNSGLLVFEALS